MTDPRYNKINELFIQYSNGNFDYRIEISEKLDEIDAFISNINMLGEELRETTISKKFFNNIFDSVSDMIFVLDKKGKIIRVNKSVTLGAGFDDDELIGASINNLFSFEYHNLFNFNEVVSQLKNITNFQFTFIYKEENTPVLCTFNQLISEEGDLIGYILIVKDISNLKEMEEMLKVSEDKYRKLFEESGDAILIVSSSGRIMEINSVGNRLLGVSPGWSSRTNLLRFLYYENEKKFIKTELSEKRSINNFKIKILNKADDRKHICLISAVKISSSDLFQVIIKDISEQSEIDNLVIRTITDTQENERVRFARDIHDSMGQELSAVKFYLSTLRSSVVLDEKNQHLLERSEVGINSILANIREICFNLMPKTIENYGLVAAVNELCRSIELSGRINFKMSVADNFPRLSIDKELSVFRIIQEFINNSVKHSGAKKIFINFKYAEKEIIVRLRDNGCGFEITNIRLKNGMGLKNVVSRAKSHNGNLRIKSKPGSGTQYEVKFPI